jgi:hypothetical protein
VAIYRVLGWTVRVVSQATLLSVFLFSPAASALERCPDGTRPESGFGSPVLLAALAALIGIGIWGWKRLPKKALVRGYALLFYIAASLFLLIHVMAFVSVSVGCVPK